MRTEKQGKWEKLGLEGISNPSREQFGGIWGKVASSFRKLKLAASCGH